MVPERELPSTLPRCAGCDRAPSAEVRSTFSRRESLANATKPVVLARVKVKVARKKKSKVHLKLSAAGKRDLKKTKLLHTSPCSSLARVRLS